MKLIKTTKILVLTWLMVAVFTVQVDAVSMSPASGTVAVNSSQTLAIVATPPSGSTAVQVRLTVSGATITNYTLPSSSSWLSIPACGGGAAFTSTQICIDLSKTDASNIASGESLGTVTIQIPASGSVTFTRGSENAYLVGSNLQFSTGTAGTYTIGASSNLPNTALFDADNARYFGAGLVLAGATLVIYVRINKPKVQDTH